MNSQYANAVPAILAEMEQGRREDDNQQRPDHNGQEGETVHVYRTSDGGVLFTHAPIGEQEPQAPIVDSQEPETDTRPRQHKDPPYFLHFILLLLLFVGLDSADTTLTALFSPTATITIIPQERAITTTATFPIASLQGRVLPALTLSQSQTVNATGHGHQDARSATGTVTFYNGLSTVQNVSAGTVLTGQDAISVASDAAVTIPPANPPSLGETSVTAHVVRAGSTGNIQAGDINMTLSAGLYAKNPAAFTGGEDARDFTFVTGEDIQQAMNTLTSHLLQSERAALSAQLQPGEALVTTSCTQSSFSNHKNGDEATTVTITVSETCRATAYSQQALQQRATQFLVTKASTLGKGFSPVGAIQITVRSAIMPPGSATLTATLHGVWVYQLNEQQIKNLVAGKSRLDAIQLLSSLPGIQRISIAGIADNQTIPDDFTHIHLLIIVGVS
jgi:hypothetical protein